MSSSPVAPQRDIAWEGVLTEHLSQGLIYINDANARDSTSAFEAALFTETIPPGFRSDLSDKAEAFWTPSIDQVLKLGSKILDTVQQAPGSSAPSYRYVLIAVLQGGRRKILAQALCETPDWWTVQLGQSQLCRSGGSCGQIIPPSLRGDCRFKFTFDEATGTLERDDR